MGKLGKNDGSKNGGYCLGKSLKRAKVEQARTVRQTNRSSRVLPGGSTQGVMDEGVEGDRKENAAALQSKWEGTDLDEFLAAAEQAGRNFAAERKTTLILGGGTHIFQDNRVRPMTDNKDEGHWLELSRKLTIPKRPRWSRRMSAAEVNENEQNAFLNWRREMAQLEVDERVLLTPFEKNLEVWRQLWRVVERSDVVFIIADARHPLMFRSHDLEQWVNSLRQVRKPAPGTVQPDPEHVQATGRGRGRGRGGKNKKKGKRQEPEPEVEETEEEARAWEGDQSLPLKESILLLNKADFLTEKQRQLWADYFKKEGTNFIFFSAKTEADKIELEVIAAKKAKADERVAAGEESESEDEDPIAKAEENETDDAALASPSAAAVDASVAAADMKERLEWAKKNPTHVYTRDELLALMEDRKAEHPHLTVGTVGYPNVGKSSTINVMFGQKKVTVSATPGKTKHFQTLKVNDWLTLCDCPGLVFPSFASTREQMVVDGILPIDKLRDCVVPVGLITSRIGKDRLEEVYGLDLRACNDVDASPSPAEFLLNQLARKRGFMTEHDKPHRHKAAREVLKDYVNGVLLYAHPPPKGGIEGGQESDEDEEEHGEGAEGGEEGWETDEEEA